MMPAKAQGPARYAANATDMPRRICFGIGLVNQQPGQRGPSSAGRGRVGHSLCRAYSRARGRLRASLGRRPDNMSCALRPESRSLPRVMVLCPAWGSTTGSRSAETWGREAGHPTLRGPLHRRIRSLKFQPHFKPSPAQVEQGYGTPALSRLYASPDCCCAARLAWGSRCQVSV